MFTSQGWPSVTGLWEHPVLQLHREALETPGSGVQGSKIAVRVGDGDVQQVRKTPRSTALSVEAKFVGHAPKS
jgi:hypothetical protein